MSRAAFRLKGAGWYETDFKSSDKRKADIYKQLNDLLFEGSLDKAIPSSAATKMHKLLVFFGNYRTARRKNGGFD